MPTAPHEHTLAPQRVLLVWCPDWPTETILRLHGETQRLTRDTPIAVTASGRIHACNAAARSEGVTRGLKLREAQSRCPALHVTAHRPDDDARAYEPVLTATENLMPGVQPIRPGVSALRVKGPAAYYGGEEEAALWLLDRLDEIGVAGARIGIADGAFTAEQAARQRQPQRIRIVPPGTAAHYLAPLTIETLDDTTLTTLLRRLGVYTLGDFARLDNNHVRDRLGEHGVRLHALAGGLDSRPLQARTPPPDLDATIDFEPPLDRIDQVAFGIRALAEKFITTLTTHKLVCTSLHIELHTERGEHSTRTWLHPHTFTPADIVDRVRWQLQGAATDMGLSSAITTVHLTPAAVDPISNHEQGLFGGGPDERIHHALSRLQSMLGRTGVLTGAIGGGRAPADRTTLTPWGDRTTHQRQPGQPWPGRLPHPPPATIFEPPRPITVFTATGTPASITSRGTLTAPPTSMTSGHTTHRITAWAGPWTARERWWDPQHASHTNRFQIVDHTGTAWLIAHQHNQWWLEARYD